MNALQLNLFSFRSFSYIFIISKHTFGCSFAFDVFTCLEPVLMLYVRVGRWCLNSFLFVSHLSFKFQYAVIKKYEGGASIYMYVMLPWFVYDTSRAVLSPLMNRVKKTRILALSNETVQISVKLVNQKSQTWINAIEMLKFNTRPH
jgi:hypothetical protein